MKKLKAVKCGIVICLLVTIVSACATQAAPPLETAPSKTPTIMATIAPTDTPSPTPTPLPTPTPIFIVRADSQIQSTDPTTFTYVGTLFETFDPAESFGQIIQNVYETLVFFDSEKPDVLVPHLAESWEVSPDGKTYTFHIREGVKFHNGESLTPSDVAYSFQRSLLQSGVNQWLLSEPFFGAGILDISSLIDESGSLAYDRESLKRTDPARLKSVCEKVKSVIVADDNAGTVTMNLAQPWNAFLPALAHPVSSIMNAKWVSENGGWDGSCDTWQKYYAPQFLESPFAKIANGTGSFKLTHWSEWGEIVLTRNDDYWQEAAKLQRINIKYEWNGNTVLSMMKINTVDGVWAQEDYRQRMEEFVGERCEYDVTTNVYKPCEVVDETKSFVLFTGKPTNSQSAILFNYNITGSYGNPYIGSAKLDGKGIPNDFFADVHIRKAFAYCFNWDTFINDVYKGNAIQATQLLSPSLIGFNPDIPHYQFDLASCEKEFKLADVDKDGIPAGEDPDDIWEIGFQFKAIYTSGDFTQSISEILAKNVNSINPKFAVTPTFLPLNTYYAAQSNNQFPIAVGGWSEDIHDPYNWFQPFTTGSFGKLQSLPDDLKAKFQEIYNRGLVESDTLKRAEIYHEASLLYYDEAVSIPLVLTTDDYFWQRWVEGIIINPYFPRTYFYSISKK